MWRRRNEEWQRRKSYLVRSLLENVSNLSPIAECNEADILCTVNNSVPRAYSPLPDLIIEREKNRHDESDEFYQELEVNMVKLFKKLFHGLEDDSSEETYKEQNISEVDISQYNSFDDSSTSVSNISDTPRLNEAIEVAHETSTEPQEFNRTMESESSQSITREIIVTRAIVHREPTNDEREDLNNNKERLVVTQAKTDQDIKIKSEDDEDEIEVMRLVTRKMNSLGSISVGTTPGEESVTPIAMVERRMSHVQNDNSTSQSTEVRSDSSELNILNQAFYFRNFHHSASKRTRSSTTVSDDSSNKKKKYETVSVQTDPINRITIWEEVRGNFFRGTPMIYNLCRCRNHKCE